MPDTVEVESPGCVANYPSLRRVRLAAVKEGLYPKVAPLLIALTVIASLVYIGLVFPVVQRENHRKGETRETWYDKVNATQPSVTGALQYYKALPDGQEVVSQRCQTCAVVSSSGVLLGKGAGTDIDSRSCVIRMNMAPVEGYQDDVGKRTTFRVINFQLFDLDPATLPANSQILVWGLFRRRSYLVRAMNMTETLRASGSTIYGQTRDGEHAAAMMFAKEINGETPGRSKSWLSTGWFSLMVAVDLCQEIHVYGMVPSDYCDHAKKDVPYHYYKGRGEKGTACSVYKAAERNKKGAHRFMTEKAVFARWALRYNIIFHTPEWTPERDKILRKPDTPFIKSLGR